MGMKLEKWRSRTNLTFWTLIMDHPLKEKKKTPTSSRTDWAALFKVCSATILSISILATLAFGSMSSMILVKLSVNIAMNKNESSMIIEESGKLGLHKIGCPVQSL